VKTGSVIAVAAVVAAVLGVTGGIAYAALPNTSSGKASTAAPPFHTTTSPDVRGAAPRKQAKATCPAGEVVAGGGYLVTGAFQNAKPAPKAVPIATESSPSLSPSATLPNEWSVTAIAPSNFAGRWTLRAYALCG
jgi:hypothetical protein